MDPGEIQPALFLDRDGIVNVDSGYVWEIEKFRFQDKIFELCQDFKDKKYKIVIVTNQSGIGRGYFSLSDFHKLNSWMFSRFEEEGCRIDLLLASTLDPNDISASHREKNFRKPAPGMLLAAKEILNLDLENSLIIGDSESDMEAGFRAGVKNRFLVSQDQTLLGNFQSFSDLSSCLIRLRETF
jgi:D-glycero-D-manno-heptose 1,7-bisphosphate phosphatase